VSRQELRCSKNFKWCREGESNPHSPFGPADFKSAASANFAIPACDHSTLETGEAETNRLEQTGWDKTTVSGSGLGVGCGRASALTRWSCSLVAKRLVERFRAETLAVKQLE
jgi:hypothetical protein